MDIQRNADIKKMEMMWDKKAATYPRYAKADNSYEEKMLNLMEQLGADPSGLSVLDVGCGSGKYTLRLAQKAKHITATDLSSEMLRFLNEDAEREGIKNITTIHTDWDNFDAGEQKFDIVFCSTTPAVRNPADFRRVTELAEKFVVYIGFAGKKETGIMSELFKEFGITPKPFNDTPVLKKWLEEQKIPFKSVLIEDMWDKNAQKESIKKQCADELSAYGIENAEKEIEEVVSKYTNANGVTEDKMYVRMELIVWGK